jgi:hypothetical protein
VTPDAALFMAPQLRDYRSRRVSSFDTSGGNHDWFDIEPGERKVLAPIDGPGIIRHIWMTMGFPSDEYLRRVVLRFYWDGCAEPSVECPIGDFFGLGHALRRNFTTAMLSMGPQDGRACNSWWPMPFRSQAQIEVENQGPQRYSHYFYVDYESYDSAAALNGLAYFHVQWRRENPTRGWGDEYNHLVAADAQPPGRLHAGSRMLDPRPQAWFDACWFGGDLRSLNRGLSAAENYVILAARGEGIYCGAHLDIDVFERQKNDWYGEGDDMTFIDGDLGHDFDAPAWAAMEPAAGAGGRRAALTRHLRWPPTLHGTGTEDWCNTAFGPHAEFCAPYHGILLYNGTADWKWRGKQSIYRYYVLDPIRFRERILATIEHGHANKLSNDYSSTAYYYLSRPQRGGPPLPPVEQRLPRPDEAP